MCVIYAGALYPTSMRINDQGKLVVNFRTEARFRGLFVAVHHGKFFFYYPPSLEILQVSFINILFQ